jgi:O-acetyl-ADP-ribose deacetylase (regulator of RNase III)
MKIKVKNTVIRLVEGDITELTTDAIVNAAGESLIMGGGVAGAIRRRGGESIQKECNRIGRTPVGTAVITTGGRLSAKYVIHAVGPRMGEGDEEKKLYSATLSALKLADKHNLNSIAFPAISTGIFGYPVDSCAKVMLSCAISYAKASTNISEIVFCLFGKKTFNIFSEELKQAVS